MLDTLPGLIRLLAQVLMHFVWQGTLVGLVSILAFHVLRGARPQARYAVACLALFACILLPLVTVVAQLTTGAAESSFATTPSRAVDLQDQVRYPFFGITSVIAPAEASNWIVAGWMLGTGTMLVRFVLGVVWVSRACSAAHGPAQRWWQERLDALAMDLGCRGQVTLRLADKIDSPLTAGWWRPVVLLPTALISNMPVALIEALLAHELAHIRRHDYLVNLLQNVVEVLMFYHPVIWWLSHRIRVERELIADQIASEVSGPRRLALALTELAEIQLTRAPLHLAQCANGGELMRRIGALIRPVRGIHADARLVFCMVGLMAASVATYTYAHVSRSGDTFSAGYSSETTMGDKAQPVKIRETFSLLNGEGAPLFIYGPDDDLTPEVIARSGVRNSAIWTRRNRQDYLIVDPESFARAAQTWRDANSLALQMDDLDRQMQKSHGELKQLQQSGRSSAKSAAENGTDQQMATLERRYESLLSRQEAAAEKAADQTRDLISQALAKGLATRVPHQ
ncbi:MAG: M56 family metallopeptidase [Telluria sp.]